MHAQKSFKSSQRSDSSNQLSEDDTSMPTIWDEIMSHKDVGHNWSESVLSRLEGKYKEENYKIMDKEIGHNLFDGNNIVDSYYKTNMGSSRGQPGFVNEFFPGVWMLKRNFRADRGRVYASNIVLQQYRLISNRENFYGVLPKVIVRWNVTNNSSLKTTSVQDGDPADATQREMVMRKRFLENSDNGKHTQHILDDLGLCATKVERFIHNDGLCDNEVIAVFVSPTENQGNTRVTEHEITQEHTRATLRRDERIISDVLFEQRQFNRNPVSQVLHSAWRSTRQCIYPRTSL